MNKRVFAFILILLTLTNIPPLPVFAQEPIIQANSAILMDVETGQILWEKNGTKKMPPASTTKVLTAILAYDLGNVKKICTVSLKAASIGESSIHLRAGEKLLLGDLLKGALIKSGNDACVAIAENISGSESLFVNWMNIKGQILGAENSNFINTNGLPAKNHQVSALDLAMISRYALHNQEFSNVVRQRGQVIGQGTSKRYLKNTNKLLWDYPECIGVKTGTTDAAGPCLVSAVEKNGKKYLAVVLNSPDRYGDSYRLLEYGINNYKSTVVLHEGELVGAVQVNHGKKPNVGAEIAKDEVVILPKENGSFKKRYYLMDQIDAPIKAGQSLGHIDVLDHNNHLMSKINVMANESIPEDNSWWINPIEWPSHLEKLLEKN